MAEVGPVALDEVYSVLSDRLRFLRTEPPPRCYGRVWIGSIEEARGRSFDVVFLPGVAEGIFPRRAQEDPLLLDVYRWEIGRLPIQDDRVSRERLLLRIAAGCARERLVVSYPRMDSAQARPRVPSFYALEVIRAAEGLLPDLREFEKRAQQGAPSRLGFPAPVDAEQAIDDAEYDLAILDRLRRAPKGEAAGGGRYLVLANPYVARSLRSRYLRWERPKWTYADGLVNPDEGARAALDAHRLPKRPYSPTALQHFAACPYRFLLYSVHKLEPRECKIAIEKLDPLTRGALFHEAQFDFFRALQRDGLLPLRPAELTQALDLIDNVLNSIEARYAEELAPAIPGVWNTEIEDIRTDLRGWVRQIAEALPGWTPIHFEYAFGLRAEANRDPASVPEPAVIFEGMPIRGSVDLIEKHDATGVLRITDHKTGKPPEHLPLNVGGGRHLQPLLYSLAVEQLLGSRVEMARLSYCTHRGNYTDLYIAIKDQGRHSIKFALDTIENHFLDGFFPAAPDPDACGYCDYHVVCGPYEALRVARKSSEELVPLNQLRGTP
jgi:ATP-dependent helicase/DNAse subunit B